MTENRRRIPRLSEEQRRLEAQTLPEAKEVLYYALTLGDPHFGEKITPLVLSAKRLIIFGPADAGKTTIADQIERDILDQTSGEIKTKRVKNDEAIARLALKYPGFPDTPYPEAWEEYSDEMYDGITQPLASDERLVAELSAVGLAQNRGRSTLHRLRQDIANGKMKDALILYVAADPKVIDQNAPLRGKVPTTPNKDVLSTVWREAKTRIVFDKEKVRGLTTEQLGFLAKMLFSRKAKPNQVELFNIAMRRERENKLKGKLNLKYLDSLKEQLDRRAYGGKSVEDTYEYLKIIGQGSYYLYDYYKFDQEHARLLINPYLDQPRTMYYDMQHYDDDTALYNSTVWTPAKSRRK